jgi:hypothetical protein
MPGLTAKSSTMSTPQARQRLNIHSAALQQAFLILIVKGWTKKR